MPTSSAITPQQSGAFVELFDLPPTGEGPLARLSFAIKDLIDVAGKVSGCGNPTWRATHSVAAVHAVCVEQLLAAGGRGVGKTVTDELAFSLIGENHFYGTPLNPAAPDHVPGGSSSGSASAVACGLADFALGTDTGGSVRVPASNCGIWGWRPTHGVVSVAGVMPFAPTFDTVGVLAREPEVLQRVAQVLLAGESPPADEPTTIYVLDDAFALAESGVSATLDPLVEQLRRRHGDRVRTIPRSDFFFGPGVGNQWQTWLDTYYVLQWSEIGSTLGAWIAEQQPEFGPATANSFRLVQGLDRRRVREAIAMREACCRDLRRALGPRDLLCLPTVPSPAPAKASNAQDRTSGYYRSALSLTALSGIGRLPQVSLPLVRTPISPVGLSLIGAAGEDMFLLAAAARIAKELGGDLLSR